MSKVTDGISKARIVIDGEEDCPIVPMADHIVVTAIEVSNVSAGGVHLASEQKSPYFRVVAVGPGALRDEPHHPAEWRLPMQCQVGDKVLIGGYAGTDVEEAGVRYRVVRDSDVVARVMG